MAELNLDRIRELAGEIISSLEKLRKLATYSEGDFLDDFQRVDSAKYNLVTAVEAAIDICNHVVAKKGGRSPCDYADCFRVLGELNIFPSSFVERLVNMAKFRNLLVHLYWNVDNKRVYKIIKEDIVDLEEYLKGLGKFIGVELI